MNKLNFNEMAYNIYLSGMDNYIEILKDILLSKETDSIDFESIEEARRIFEETAK